MTLSPLVRRVLERGSLCSVAASTGSGPHVTPMVFSIAGDRVWVTTSRRSVKARAWRRDDRVAGLVRNGASCVAFAGRAACHDALDPASWLRSALEAPLVALAAARFTRKNARFFAGYAVDAPHVPLAWTPPGRVFVELRIDRWAVLERDRVRTTWGAWPETRADVPRPRTTSARGAREDGAVDALAVLPPDVRAAFGAPRGKGALAVDGTAGPMVVPARWSIDEHGIAALVSADAVALAAPATAHPRAALAIDRASAWRARDMVGAMVRGTATIAPLPATRGGAASTRARRPMALSDGDVAVAVEPERLTWWRGWESGTVALA